MYQDHDLDSVGEEGDLFTILETLSRRGRDYVKATDKYGDTHLFKVEEMEVVPNQEGWQLIDDGL